MGFQLPLAGYLGRILSFPQTKSAGCQVAKLKTEPLEPKETDANDADAAKEDKGGKARLSKAERRRGVSFR